MLLSFAQFFDHTNHINHHDKKKMISIMKFNVLCDIVLIMQILTVVLF